MRVPVGNPSMHERFHQNIKNAKTILIKTKYCEKSILTHVAIGNPDM